MELRPPAAKAIFFHSVMFLLFKVSTQFCPPVAQKDLFLQFFLISATSNASYFQQKWVPPGKIGMAFSKAGTSRRIPKSYSFAPTWKPARSILSGRKTETSLHNFKGRWFALTFRFWKLQRRIATSIEP